VSAINVVNFMDGIDGLIGSQLALYGAYVALLAPAGSVPALLGVAVAGASLGFLRSNWAPAAIFLGDVGSGAYGVLAVLAGLGLVSAGEPTTIVRAYLPLFPLFLDATVTLVRRARAGERLATPHRSHLYQRLANGPWGHARTTLAYGAAAAIGCAVGLLPGGGLALTVTAAYCAGTAVVGRRAERLVPWRSAAPPVTGVTDVRPEPGEAL
jgi:UDP-N-acetylmuramyl pentapeptide phosphotransferase/UDP-N-acetylglucosamine-1-phosphate transferase